MGRDPNKKVQLSIRIKPELKERVQRIAGDDETSVSELMCTALEQYLDRTSNAA